MQPTALQLPAVCRNGKSPWQVQGWAQSPCANATQSMLMHGSRLVGPEGFTSESRCLQLQEVNLIIVLIEGSLPGQGLLEHT